MKKMLANFENGVLSRSEMKNVIGGGSYKCQAGNLQSTEFPSRDATTAQAACTASSFCQSYGSSSCTAIVA